MKPTIIFCDFDGTIFDPDLRMMVAPWYNSRSTQLMDGTDTKFIVTTGRHSWGPWTRLNYALSGMRPPDTVIAGAGTIILNKNHNGDDFVIDKEWEDKMRREFDKSKLQKKLAPILAKNTLTDYNVPNDHMIVITVYQKALDEAAAIREELALLLKEDKVKVILSEQLFFKNTTELFNGYALIVPHSAGKDGSALYVLQEYEKTRREAPNMLAFGDASIDIPMLTMKQPENTASYQSYGVHLTPLARTTVEKDHHDTHPQLLEGIAPRSIFQALGGHYKGPRNSPYRTLLAPFEHIIDKTIHPNLSPNELTKKGLEDVRRGLKEGGARGFLRVVYGHMIDAADGIRARRRPHLKTTDGQLIDVYADRVKEFESLMTRNQPEAAITCILPSIARAQAEAMNKTVYELDNKGGSALSRTRRLLTSLALYTAGLKEQSTNIDKQLAAANLATFKVRRFIANDFSWSPAKLQTYDKPSMERLLLLVDLLQSEYTQIEPKLAMKDIEEYLKVKTADIRKTLKLPNPHIAEQL